MIGEIVRAKPKMTIVLAILAISAGLVLGLAREALADYTFNRYSGCCGNSFSPDSNGYVPEYEGRPNGSSSDLILGTTYFYRDPGGNQSYIKYDNAEMRRCNANRYDYLALYAHERAHSRGWGHYERPASKNAAYNPKITGVVCP